MSLQPTVKSLSNLRERHCLAEHDFKRIVATESSRSETCAQTPCELKHKAHAVLSFNSVAPLDMWSPRSVYSRGVPDDQNSISIFTPSMTTIGSESRTMK